MPKPNTTIPPKAAEEMLNALLVFVLCPETNALLKEHDPMALAQASDAIAAAMGANLTVTQTEVLKMSVDREGWRGGWVWGSQSQTERVFESLTKKGLAVPVGDQSVTPCYYDLTPDGVTLAKVFAAGRSERHPRVEAR